MSPNCPRMCLFSLFQIAFRALASREAALDRSHVRGALSYAVTGPFDNGKQFGSTGTCTARGFEIAGARCMRTKHIGLIRLQRSGRKREFELELTTRRSLQIAQEGMT